MMFFLKGLLIFSPPFLYKLSIFNRLADKRNYFMWFVALIILIVTISTFSFTGWLIDYIIFCIGASMLLRPMITQWARPLRILIQSASAVIFVGYITINNLFGPELISAYKKNNLTFRIYRIPDMVIAPTYRLTVHRSWAIFETKLFGDRIPGPHCEMFDFDENTKQLITIDTCKINRGIQPVK
jgi:hypothetical protein